MFSGNDSRTTGGFGGFGVNTASKAASESTVPQNIKFGSQSSLFSAGSGGSNPPAGGFRFGQSDAPNSPVAELVAQHTCSACESTLDLSLGFCCGSCCGFYHRMCPIRFGAQQAYHMFYFGLDICNFCHSRLQNATPAVFPITRPLSLVPACQTSRDNDETRMPRRSSRDEAKIPRCESPDQVIITAEHFTTDVEDPFFNSIPEITFSESDEPSIEALFEVNDLVVPVNLPRNHPDRTRPFKVTARHFNSKLYPGDDSGTESSDEGDINHAERNASKEHSVPIDKSHHNMDDVFGKYGWYYKLERHPASESLPVAEVILWHEDSLKLALDDDSDDEEDLDDVMEVNVERQDGIEETEVEEVIGKEETIVEETVTEGVVTEHTHAGA